MLFKKKILFFPVLFLLILISITFLQIFKPAKNLVKVKPDFIVTSNELFDDFSTNEELANSKYIGKIILIQGAIEEIIHNEGQTIIILQTDDLFSGISCRLSDAENSKTEFLEQGQSIRIKGQCSGKLIDIILNNCVIVDKND